MSSLPQQNLTQRELLERVSRVLDQNQPPSYRLEVVPSNVRREDDWWYVTVVPNRGGVQSHDYAERLTAVEETLNHELGLNILLIPTLVGD